MQMQTAEVAGDFRCLLVTGDEDGGQVGCPGAHRPPRNPVTMACVDLDAAVMQMPDEDALCQHMGADLDGAIHAISFAEPCRTRGAGQRRCRTTEPLSLARYCLQS